MVEIERKGETSAMVEPLMFRLFPSLLFDIKNIIVSGMPWNTVAVVEWSAAVTPVKGDSYTNTGVHIITLKWGKAVKISAYENAELVANACNDEKARCRRASTRQIT